MFITFELSGWFSGPRKHSLQKISALALLLFCSLGSNAQSPVKGPAASVSGRVTIDGKGAAGITVTATTTSSPLDNRTVARITTDDDGKYKLTGLAAGQFTIAPLAKAFVVSTGGAFKQPGQSISVGDGEAVSKIDFALVRGGVITGRITDSNGHPVIGERVSVVLTDGQDSGRPNTMFDGPRNTTDDRGVYRVYGLSPGTYKVSIGQAASAGGVTFMGMGGSQYAKTFYPGVPEDVRATPIEISEGSEVSNIDIVAGSSGASFSVSGRVVNADSGQPVPSVYVAYASLEGANQQLGGMNFTGSQTDANGKFRLENVHAGHYAAYILSVDPANSSYSDQAPFDVSEGDVSGVEIKVHSGATISGVAVIENNFDAAVAASLKSVLLFAFSNSKGGAPSFSRSQIAADGSFTFSGLAPGKVQINITGFPTPAKSLRLVRTELDGVAQPEGIEVTAGAKITGVRLVLAYGAGSIRGEVRAENGVIPEGLTLRVIVSSASAGGQEFSGLVDARGHFVVENVPPGTYEMSVFGIGTDRSSSSYEPAPRTVNVESGPVDVILVVNFAARKAPLQ